MENNNLFIPKLLYFGIGNIPSTSLHSHAFYQIEYCIDGQLNAIIDNKEISLHSGDCCIIPPELTHEFLDCKSEYKYISLKFHLQNNVKFEIINKPEISYYMGRIIDIIESNIGISAYSSTGKNIIESYIYSIIHNILSYTPAVQDETEFITKCKEQICKYNYNVNIDSLAEHFNLTRAQFKYKFITEYSNKNCTIKSFIDEILIDLINNHMKYSEMSISKIAYKMNFPNVYTFSRFYKRKTGISPIEFRKNL